MIRRAVIILVLVAVAAGCAPPPPHHHPIVVGDSITFGLQYSHRLGPLGPAQGIDGCPGRSIRWGGACATGYEALRRLVGSTRSGDLVIIEMGTNDTGGSPSFYRGWIRDMLSLVPRDRCVAWATPHNGQRRGNTAVFNAILRQEMAAVPCHSIIEWDWWVDHVSGLVGGDLIHLTAKGQVLLVDLYVQAMRYTKPKPKPVVVTTTTTKPVIATTTTTTTIPVTTVTPVTTTTSVPGL